MIGSVDAPTAILLTTAEAARMLGVNPSYVRRLAARGDLPSVRTPYGRLFRREALEHRRGNPLRAALSGKPRTQPDQRSAAPEEAEAVIFIDHDATVRDAAGFWPYVAGWPYRVPASHAEALVRQSLARTMDQWA